MESPPPSIQPRAVSRILVVEDNIDTAASLQRLLLHLGFDTAIAHSGNEGIECAKSFLPEVVLCDLGLPDVDGFTVARSLRQHTDTQGSLLIAQSGYGHADDVRRALDAGFDLHLVKPINVDELLEVLKASSSSTHR